ncbi:MAG TPA: outer membrane beta-barrel protein, partial [Bacteroidales bacterium]|nr:outer membrane beta-barrel protein [Bacteroidales bacterium]
YQPLDFLNVHAGAQFGYLLSALQKDNVSGNKEKINVYYKKADLGLVIGAEANLPFRINLTVRYVFGLIAASVESSDPYDPLYIEPWKNNFLQISAGFRIRGK